MLDSRKLALLVVLDGWGMALPGPGNALSQAKIPNMTRFWASFPHTQLGASGDSVGLPRGEPGNTETGHLNLGAGRIIYQDLARINMSIADGTFFVNQAFKGAFEHAKKMGSRLHLMGLVGAGGVHSNMEHLFALIQMAAREQLDEVYIHCFTDGRDSPPNASKTYIDQIKGVIQKEGVGTIASIMGRYWAMDRNFIWNRTAKAYFALTHGKGALVKTPEEAIENSYNQGVTDEFIEPSLISNAQGKPISLISENDAVIFFNFRIDRPRQLSRAFVFEDMSQAEKSRGFDPYAVKYEKKHIVEKAPTQVLVRGERIKNLYFATMTEYEKSLVEAGAKPAFPPEVVPAPLGGILSTHNLKQLRMSESEKERFVTFYFNGLREAAYPGEERLIVPSPKVATYDLWPQMSSRELTDALMDRLKKFGDYSFVLVNYASPDMVGHTGNIKAAIKAVEVVDECLGRLSEFILAYGGAMFITADHGNVEGMINDQGDLETEHSDNPVPFIAVTKKFLGNHQMLQSGILADVAPTILSFLGIETPSTMMGRNLIKDLV